MANGILGGEGFAQFGEAQAILGAENDARQPRRFLRTHDLQPFIHPFLSEPLRRHPYLRVRVRAMEHFDLFFQQGHHVFRLRVARVPARHEHRVDARQFLEYATPFFQFLGHGCGVGVVFSHCGIPNPDREAVIIRQLRQPGHHLDLWQREMGAVGGVVRLGGHQFHGVGSKNGEVAVILLPHWQIPRVVGVHLRAEAQLMAAQCTDRRRIDGRCR